jgi:hypothetical protein
VRAAWLRADGLAMRFEGRCVWYRVNDLGDGTMLIFAGMDADKADERSAKLKALQAHYGESDPAAWQMLGPQDLSSSNAKRGTKLVVNSHGNGGSFAGMDAQAFYQKLVGNGFEAGAFQALYLVACSVGIQDQMNTIITNFARDLFSLLGPRGIPIKLYAPRGIVRYTVQQQTKLGQSYYVVTDISVRCPERDYPLDEGMLLVSN